MATGVPTRPLLLGVCECVDLPGCLMNEEKMKKDSNHRWSVSPALQIQASELTDVTQISRTQSKNPGPR